MQVDVYQDNEGKNKYNTYILVEELEFLESRKKEEDNEFKDFKINTEVQQQFDYDSSDLPF
jgi:single-stranded DNA-binding protein